MDFNERAAQDALRKQLADCRRQNARLRAAMLHDCAVCRIAWCDARERLIDQALGRQRQTLRTERLPDA